MKKIIKIIASIFLLLTITSSIFAINSNVRGKGYGNNQQGQVYQLYDDTQINRQSQIDSLPVEDLSQEEIDGLILMREEEKLARDVYLKLYEIWGQQIFSNIASSEQTHTDAIKALLEKYDLEDPVLTDTRGVFENDNLQNLYNDLVAKGEISLIDALEVGATVEDLDIKDLEDLLKTTNNQDITQVYSNLQKGSRNHLRSFVKVLQMNGADYTPQYISYEEYNNIISTSMETGNTNSISQANNQNQNQNKVQVISQDNNQIRDEVQSQNIFARMWRGFKAWFS